jgi:hypothetical protein
MNHIPCHLARGEYHHKGKKSPARETDEMRGRRYIGVLLAVSVLAADVCSFAAQQPAQQSEPPSKSAAKQEPAAAQAPVAIPADAIALGVKMAESAPPDFLKWARGYAKREILKKDAAVSLETVAQAIEKRYPKAPAQARKAAAFLVWYLGYVQETGEQTSSAARIRDLDRLISEAEQDLHIAENAPAKRAPANPRVGQITDEDRAMQRLDGLNSQRDFQRGHMAQLQARADACLQRLAALYETLKDADPAEIRGLK